jgi:hypothetical protein
MTEVQTPESLGDPDAVNLAGRVRSTDRDTSQDAAGALTNGILRERQQQVYAILTAAPDGLTDDEIRAAVLLLDGGVSKSGPATRRGELERSGWVRAMQDENGTVKRPSDNGHPMTVWVAVPEEDWTGPVLTAREQRAAAAHERGMQAARRRALWELGQGAWADAIVDAYLRPDESDAELEEAMGS